MEKGGTADQRGGALRRQDFKRKKKTKETLWVALEKLFQGVNFLAAYVSFPEDIVTNDYKLGGLKQQKLIFSVWRPEVRNLAFGRAVLHRF